jgi:hypothetical protein
MALEKDIETYLRKYQQPAKAFAKDFQAAHELVLYGETHIKLERKADFFKQLIQDGGFAYHASEHFENTLELGKKIEDYLEGRLASAGLPAPVRVFTPMLDAIKPKLKGFGLVFAGSLKKGGERDAYMFADFKLSRNKHIESGRFGKKAKGHFHLGAAHAALAPWGGSTKTVAQRLSDEGFEVGSIRLYADKQAESESSDLGMSFEAGENGDVEVLADDSSLDLLAILRKVAGGNAFACSVRETNSPFKKVRPQFTTGSRAFTDYFHALMFLP